MHLLIPTDGYHHFATMDLQQHFTDEWRNIWFHFITNKKGIWWSNLSCNENVTFALIQKHRHLPWDWKSITRNKNITMEIIKKNPDMPWVADDLIHNPNVTMEIINLYKFRWSDIVSHPLITIKYIDKHFGKSLNKQWNKSDALSRNPNITIHDVITHPKWDWSWYVMSMHKNITMDDIENNLHLPWKFHWVSSNPNVTINYILSHRKFDWGWYWISKNPNISMQNIIDNPDCFWDWIGVSQNPNLTLEMLRKNPYKSWSWKLISANSAITMDMIANNPDLSWCMYGIMYNPNITMETINNNPSWNWDWSHLSRMTFSIDKTHYVENHTKSILLLSLHEHYNTHFTQVETGLECILFDCYVVTWMDKY